MASPQVVLEPEYLAKVLNGELTREEAVQKQMFGTSSSLQSVGRAEAAVIKPTPDGRSVAGRRGKLSTSELRQVLDAAIEETGIEPICEMLRMVRAGELTMDQKIKILSEVNSYRMPKLKAVEVKGDIDLSITVNVKHYDQKVQSQDSFIEVDSKETESK